MKDSSILLQLVHGALTNMGLDAEVIYNQYGFTAKKLQDKSKRFKHDANRAFWHAAEEITNDPCIGLHVAEHLPLYRGQVLEYPFISSQTFGDGLIRALNYQRLLSDVAQAYLVNEESDSRLVVDTRLGSNLNHHFVVCVMCGMSRFFESITEKKFKPIEIDLTISKPQAAREYERVFKCKVNFSKQHNAIHFDGSVLSQPSRYEPELLSLHEQLADQHMEKLAQQDLVQNVKNIIAELLESQEVTLDVVAKKMGMTARNLRSVLSSAQTSFNTLLSDYRSHLSKRLLVKTDEPMDEIVYLTGFSEPSTFYRAFKRWTGLTPLEYRNKNKHAEAKGLTQMPCDPVSHANE